MTSRSETLHFEDPQLSRELCPTVMLVRKLLCWWWWWIVSLVREKWALCHWRLSESSFDQKRRIWPGLLLMMTSRRETLHFDHPYLSREPLSNCHVCQKTAVLMIMMDSSWVREKCVIEDYQSDSFVTTILETTQTPSLRSIKESLPSAKQSLGWKRVWERKHSSACTRKLAGLPSPCRSSCLLMDMTASIERRNRHLWDSNPRGENPSA